jgi:hypothetical protein
MGAWMVLFGLIAAAIPALVQLYFRRLPVAPMCPACSSVAREIESGGDPLRWLPPLATTFVGECAGCGWRGRMRWRWAPRRVRRGHG